MRILVTALWATSFDRALGDRLALDKKLREPVVQVLPQPIPARRVARIDSFAPRNLYGQVEPFIAAWARRGGGQVTDAAVTRSLEHPRARIHVALGDARLLGEAHAEQEKVDDGVFVTRLESAANVRVAARYPAGPRGLELGFGLAAEVGWKQVCAKRLEDWLRVAYTGDVLDAGLRPSDGEQRGRPTAMYRPWSPSS